MLQAAGIKGKRFGSGFISYPPEKKKAGMLDSLTSMVLPKPKKTANPAALAAMKPFLKTHKIADEEIQKRIVARFVNEAIFCLQDKIIRNAVRTLSVPDCHPQTSRRSMTDGHARMLIIRLGTR